MSQEKEYTGGSVSYYAVDVNAPINEASDPYTAECQDIIEALKLDFNEGNVLKAIWRRAAARLGRSKKGYDEGLYDAEKIVFYGQRLVTIEQRAKRQTLPAGLQKVVSELQSMPSPEEVKHRQAIDTVYGPRDAEGWYAWNGDDTMRPAGLVDYLLRCDVGEAGFSGTCAADALRWVHDKIGGDIVKWRPAQ